MRTRHMLLVLGAALIGAAVVVGAMLPRDDATARVFTEADTSIRVKPDEQFTIGLSANHSTPYQWRVGEPFDERVLAFVGTEYEAPRDGPPGRGGTEVWTFRGMSAGTTTISLRYMDRFAASSPPAKEQRVAVTVAR